MLVVLVPIYSWKSNFSARSGIGKQKSNIQNSQSGFFAPDLDNNKILMWTTFTAEA